MNTHIGPHRRLWMGPQFRFKHYVDTTNQHDQLQANVSNVDTTHALTNTSEIDLKSLP
jgi:hypothetical protein